MRYKVSELLTETKNRLKEGSLSKEIAFELVPVLVKALEMMEEEYEAKIEDLLYEHEKELDCYRVGIPEEKPQIAE